MKYTRFILLSALLAARCFGATTIPIQVDATTHVLKSPLDTWSVNSAGMYNGIGLGSASLQNIGTSGANVPRLNGVNTWSAVQTFTLAPVFTDQAGTRAAIGAGTGNGTMTAVSIVTANGVSGSSSGGATPALTIALGAITPTSVNSVVLSGASTPTLAVTGTSSISGANTGDQNLSGYAPLASPTFTGTPSAPSIAIAGTGGLGFASFVSQSSAPAAPASGFGLYADASGRFSWRRQSDGFTRTFEMVATANRVLTIPDADLTLARIDAAQTLAGTQTFSTGISIASAGTLDWNSDLILSRKGAANLRRGAADAASPVAQTMSFQGARGGTDSNTAGANATDIGSLGTGTAASGTRIFQIGTPQASGTTAHVPSTGLTLSNTGVAGVAAHTATFAGNVIASRLGIGGTTPSATYPFDADATVNAGSGFRIFNLSAGSSAYSEFLTLSDGGSLSMRAHSAAHSTWPDTGLITAGSLSGGVQFYQSTSGAPWTFWTEGTERIRITGTGLIALGGVTTSFPAIKRNAAAINFRLADDSADAAITAANASASGNFIATVAGKGLQLQSGANARAGNATLTAGAVTVSNTTVTANTIVMLTRKTTGGTIGTAITYTLSAGASFSIASDNPLDTSTFSYLLTELN